ncbi:MAG: glycosyltransferase family 4 protein [Vicinamibacterales bacterium]|nr:glycosyltransferase family 4 protein [Vicinamibacterales bacterium]
MRIGVDARELGGHATGVGRHLAGLLAGWRQSNRAVAHSFILYTPRPISVELPANTTVREVAGGGGTRWEQLDLARAAREDRLDAFFAPGYSAPLWLDVPTVLLVHDISFISHPEWFRAREGFRRRLLTRWSSAKASTVLTVSHAARDEIMSGLGLPPSRVRCVYPGITALGPSTTPLVREPLVLFAGSIFNRRHLPVLIDAFRQIVRVSPDARLAIVGDNRTHPREDLRAIVGNRGLQNAVTIHAYVPDETLAGIYGRARVFAFLSEYEGFGHPPLEALKAGVAPVLLDTAVAREVCGNAALYVKLGDIDGIASAIASLLFDASTCSRVLAAAPTVLSRYSWARAADETLEAIECSI